MAVSVGGSLFGVAGMLLFIPLMSSCYALLRESVNRRNAGKRISVSERRQVPGASRPEEDADPRKKAKTKIKTGKRDTD